MTVPAGEYGHNPGYPGQTHPLKDKDYMSAMAEEYPNTNNLENKRYHALLADYFVCVGGYLDQNINPWML